MINVHMNSAIEYRERKHSLQTKIEISLARTHEILMPKAKNVMSQIKAN